jgi:hypothetical protein
VNETGESKYYFQAQNRFLTKEEEDEIETRIDSYQEMLCALAQQRWTDRLPDISLDEGTNHLNVLVCFGFISFLF